MSREVGHKMAMVNDDKITQAELLKIHANEMSEETLLQNIIDLAHTYGWLVAHFRPAKTDKGWRTPVQADGEGFPDLIMLRGGEQIVAEAKTQKGKLVPKQKIWLEKFECLYGTLIYLWRPSDWLSGEIEKVLR